MDPLRRSVLDAVRRFPRQPADRPDLKAAAVGLVLLRPGPALLLTRRASTLRGHPGQWALPGGRIEPGESPGAAARRELAEELGVGLGPEAELGMLDDYPPAPGT